MEQTELRNLLMHRPHGEDERSSWSGPRLRDVLVRARVEASAAAITITAPDGYSKRFPLADLDGAILALKCDGAPVKGGGKTGVRLVIPGKPANLWVAGFTKISVE
jgi:DMSO/TMAO reductase YedYZ molybdopterin-dependent catalytic subunit